MHSSSAAESFESLKHRQRPSSNVGIEGFATCSFARDSPSPSDGTSSTATSLLSRTASKLFFGPHTFDVNPISTPPVRKVSDYDCGTEDMVNGKAKVTPVTAASSRPSRAVLSRHKSVPPHNAPFHYSTLTYSRESSFSDNDDASYTSGSSCEDDNVAVHRHPKSCDNPAPPLFALRSRENIIIHFLMEVSMLRRDAPLVAFGIFFQLVHSAFTNLAYYYHTKLSAAQRVPLSDVMFDALPALTGGWWMVSEYICYSMIAISVACIVSILGVRWTGVPHGRPLYCMVIVRRLLMTLVSCQCLRCISFMVTTLPGASRQCLYQVPERLTAKQMVEGVADPEGNPSGWAPPNTWHDIFFHIDATNGCGDLMFSSHTIFTMLFVCVVFKYFNWTGLKRTMVSLQIAIIPFILAAHKHYTIDVFTALYVTPLVFEMLWVRCPDRETSIELLKHYGIRFYLAQAGDSYAYVVDMWGREFYIDPEDLPPDLSQSRSFSVYNRYYGDSSSHVVKHGKDSLKRPSSIGLAREDMGTLPIIV